MAMLNLFTHSVTPSTEVPPESVTSTFSLLSFSVTSWPRRAVLTKTPLLSVTKIDSCDGGGVTTPTGTSSGLFISSIGMSHPNLAHEIDAWAAARYRLNIRMPCSKIGKRPLHRQIVAV